LLDDALAWLECVVRSEHDVGDHTFFVGAVERIELGREAPGLVYVRGGYAAA
jgi:flavin reductase (DIM6/NTAB) family NADH-FMN oxidoreductase RutF